MTSSPTALAGKNAMEVTIAPVALVGDLDMRIIVFTAVQLQSAETFPQTGITIHLPQPELSLIKILAQVTQQQIPQKPLKASVLKDGHCLIKLRLTDKETSQAFPQFWAGFTAMVLCTMRIRAGSGGVLRRIMARDGTTCITMVVVYIPATAAATMGAMCAVSRLHKLIPVYSFYSYWRIKA